MFQPTRPQTSIATRSQRARIVARRSRFNPSDRRQRSQPHPVRRGDLRDRDVSTRATADNDGDRSFGGGRRWIDVVSTRATADIDRDMTRACLNTPSPTFQPARPQTSIATYLYLEFAPRTHAVSTRATADIDRDRRESLGYGKGQHRFNPRDRNHRSRLVIQLTYLRCMSKFQPARPQPSIATFSTDVASITRPGVSTRATADIDRDVPTGRGAGRRTLPFQPARPQTSIATCVPANIILTELFVSTRATADIDRDPQMSCAPCFTSSMFQPARPQTTIATVPGSPGRVEVCRFNPRDRRHRARLRDAGDLRIREAMFKPARPQTSIATCATLPTLGPVQSRFQPARPQTTIAS